jgi:DNA modification methylase
VIPADRLANLGPATILRGDARALPLPDTSVDLVVTSPPFLNLRSYQDDGHHYSGQIGTGTREQFLEDLWETTAEMARVVKPTGSIFVELGDSYTDKSLNLSPHRYAIGCTDRLGLLLRAEVIWNRPNGLPESVTDRVRRSHSVWFHFTKEPQYFAAVDEIREPHNDKAGGVERFGKITQSGSGRSDGVSRDQTFKPAVRDYNPLGKLPGSVREIPSAPLKVPATLGVDHFAAFPPAWPAWIIRGWSPSGICTVCGEGRRPVVDAEYTDAGGRGNEKWNRVEQGSGDYHFGSFKPQEMRLGRANRTTTITGYACGCPTPDAPTRPAVVLDPFGGTGTTAMAARALGRHGISVDLSTDYCRLARWRCQDLDELRTVRGIERRRDQAQQAEPSLFDVEEW